MLNKEIVAVELTWNFEFARGINTLVTLNSLKFNVHVCTSSDVKLVLICTWTIWRGCTDRVGKFPRPWMGTASPKIESKRCTWSQVKTQNRRLWSETSPQDMVMLTYRLSFPKEGKCNKRWTACLLSPAQARYIPVGVVLSAWLPGMRRSVKWWGSPKWIFAFLRWNPVSL